MGTRGRWKCEFCGKVFKGELYLDSHLDRRHQDELEPSADVCLADLCPLLHCDELTPIHAGFHAHEKRRPVAEQQKRRRQCELLAASCFPPDRDSRALHLHEYMMHYFCETLDSDTATRTKRLQALRAAHAKGRWMLSAFGIFMLVSLALFYVVLAVELRPRLRARAPRGRGDLRPREGPKKMRKGWRAILFGAKPKEY